MQVQFGQPKKNTLEDVLSRETEPAFVHIQCLLGGFFLTMSLTPGLSNLILFQVKRRQSIAQFGWVSSVVNSELEYLRDSSGTLTSSGPHILQLWSEPHMCTHQIQEPAPDDLTNSSSLQLSGGALLQGSGCVVMRHHESDMRDRNN
eukprot:4198754-Amphidinium_carterae.1